jgi:hypothetical protein
MEGEDRGGIAKLIGVGVGAGYPLEECSPPPPPPEEIPHATLAIHGN